MTRGRALALVFVGALTVCALFVAGCASSPSPKAASTTGADQSPAASVSTTSETAGAPDTTAGLDTATTLAADIAPETTIPLEADIAPESTTTSGADVASDSTTPSDGATGAVTASGPITPEQVLSLLSGLAGADGSIAQISVIDYKTFGDWAAAIIYVGGGDEAVTFHITKGQWTVKTRGDPTQGADQQALKSAGVPQPVIDWFSNGANWGD